MSERVRGSNGAWKRYKGPRELVGARVPPQVTDRVDIARADLGLSRNDYLFAALLLALEHPEMVRAAAGSLDEFLPGRRSHPHATQLRFADDEAADDELAGEVFAQPA